ncbi:hypothetical protein [Aurantimonas endophytica]|uniref:Uncharacterized protein n=1 Tax=Aurantimonas endophytica TaxID=1522175 RepID=A0A7W6MQG1_9HYPH|nr:hypothetical protein [Aurantimonas endophytica]MBB4004035.1 hypothetical protein [Aurantimonas endophytica]MCO6404883.1 hypothetical protein [Aurantimonas endophytica]
MADLSGVLRKTIDGLPRATPQLRAKVYEKARAAIQRQIQAANPPLAEDVVAARLAALEDAIDRTEAHYVGLEGGDDAAPAADVAAPSVAAPVPAPVPPKPAVPTPAAPTPAAPRPAFMPRAEAAPAVPGVDASRDRDAAQPADGRGSGSPFPGFRKSSEPARKEPPPFFPIAPEEPEETARPASVGAPFIVSPGNGTAGRHDDDDDDDVIPADIRHDGTDIPAADVSAPRYGSRQRSSGSSKRPLAAVAVVLLLAGAGAAGWIYRDELEALLIDTGPGIETIATGADEAAPGEDESAVDTAATPAEPAEGETAPEAGTDVAAVTPPASANGQSNRQFTQRLLPDGTEVDEGPAPGAANAFDEGTDIAAASPVAEPGEIPSATPTVTSEIGQDPATVGEEAPAAGAPAEATPPPAIGEEVAATDPAEGGLPVAQKAVFYQERTENTPGTQESGNVVWSVVNEPPSEGQPAEPAIRAVADVPDENLKLTMTIRRNADPTLPASHVVELMFDTPANFAGGGVANVQRLALKATEEARGEPLIGVAGKISDGFFIIALNNLDQAVQNNLSLLESQQWIDIPLAYATGRRALMSIEKGLPGDRVFKEAMDAWAAKT